MIAILFTILGEALALLVVWRILYRGRAATGATLSWIFVVLAAPYVGVLLYYLLGRRMHRKRLERRAERVAAVESHPVAPPADPSAGAPPPLERSSVLDLVDGMDEDNVHPQSRVELIADGPEFIAAAKGAIESAREFIHIQTYILRPDDTGLTLLAALTRAAERGVEVRVLYDSIGSFRLKSKHLRPLRDAGGEAVAFMPLFWRRRPFSLNLRNHRKQLLVDGVVAYCGGRNIGDEYAKAVPSTIFIAASMSLALRSGIFVSAISFTWARVTLPTFSVCGVGDPFSTRAACRSITAAGGVFVMKVNDRSS